MSESKKTREIDLFDLFASIGRGIKNLFNGLFDAILWCLFFAVKKYKVLLIFFALGLSFGVYKVITSKDVFSSTMLIRSNAISSFELKVSLDEFNDYFLQNNEFSDKLLRQELNMDSVQLSKITGIESFYGIDLNFDEESKAYSIDYFDLKESHDLSDTINVRDNKYLLIKASVLDPIVLPVFQKNFVDYLNRQPLLIEKNKQRLEKIERKLSGYDIEMMYLDSFQKANYFTTNPPSISMERNQILLGEANKQFVHAMKFDIQDKKDENIAEYTIFNEPITVINDFSIAAQQENSSVITILKNIILSLVVGFILLLVWYFLSKISGKYMARIE